MLGAEVGGVGCTALGHNIEKASCQTIANNSAKPGNKILFVSVNGTPSTTCICVTFLRPPSVWEGIFNFISFHFIFASAMAKTGSY